MITSKQEAVKMMRRDIYSAIRRNLSYRGTHLSHHEVVELLADILSGQIEIIKDHARQRRPDRLR
jgi:hypothetical protein